MEDVIIKAENVSMCFNMTHERIYNLKEYLIKFVKKQLMFNEFWALTDVSFDIKKGEVFGIVGFNGAGKSTMLKVLAGVLKPTKGSISIGGSIAPLIELGAGFDVELTARENIYLNGAILGFSRKEMESKFDEIVEFSELAEFIDVQVKNYSSGMYARLGFAIATAVDPDILIVDEILSVGDMFFQKKCEDKIRTMMEKGVTIVLVSHSIAQVQEMCTRALWLERGKLRMLGDAAEVCNAYANANS